MYTWKTNKNSKKANVKGLNLGQRWSDLGIWWNIFVTSANLGKRDVGRKRMPQVRRHPCPASSV